MPSASNSRCCGSVASTTGSKLPGFQARLLLRFAKHHRTATALAASNGGSDEREHAINKTGKVDNPSVANISCLRRGNQCQSDGAPGKAHCSSGTETVGRKGAAAHSQGIEARPKRLMRIDVILGAIKRGRRCAAARPPPRRRSVKPGTWHNTRSNLQGG